jgi:hypothetical protein
VSTRFCTASASPRPRVAKDLAVRRGRRGLGSHLRRAGLVDIRHSDAACAGTGKRQHQGASNTGAATGHDYGLVANFHACLRFDVCDE